MTPKGGNAALNMKFQNDVWVDNGQLSADPTNCPVLPAPGAGFTLHALRVAPLLLLLASGRISGSPPNTCRDPTQDTSEQGDAAWWSCPTEQGTTVRASTQIP